MDLVNQVLHLRLLLRDDIRNLRVRRLIRNKVANPDTICVGFHVFRNNILESVDEISRRDISEIIAYTLNQTDSTTAEHAFVNLTANHASISDFDHIIRGGVVFVRILLTECLLLVFQCKGRQYLRDDIEIADIFAALECGLIDTRVRRKKVHRLPRCESNILACE